MNRKAKQLTYIMAMCGAGLVMIGYAVMMNGFTLGKAVLAVGLVLLAVSIGFLLSGKKYKYCPKCGLKVTDSYIKQNVRRFGKYKCPKCSTRQTPVEKTEN